MKNQQDNDYRALLTEVIKKLIQTLGPDITFAKLHSIQGLQVGKDGTVLEIATDPSLITQQLKESFLELSSFVVSKTMHNLDTQLLPLPDQVVRTDTVPNHP